MNERLITIKFGTGVTNNIKVSEADYVALEQAGLLDHVYFKSECRDLSDKDAFLYHKNGESFLAKFETRNHDTGNLIILRPLGESKLQAGNFVRVGNIDSEVVIGIKSSGLQGQEIEMIS